MGPTRSLDFALSADHATDALYRAILERMVGVIDEATAGFGEVTVILSGSLALGEGSAHSGADGTREPASDIDLYLVVDETRFSDLATGSDGVRKILMEAAGTPGLVIDIGATSVDRLRKLSPSIANCLLVRHGKVISGHDATISKVPDLKYEDIPSWDGLLLLLNRVVEELAELRGFHSVPEGGYWYRLGKTMRDLAASALVVGGRFQPRIGDRLHSFRELATEIGSGHEVDRLVEEVDFWSRNKAVDPVEAARGRYGDTSDVVEQSMMTKRELISTLWEWEVQRTFGRNAAGDPFHTLGHEPFRRRLVSWLRFLRERGSDPVVPALRHLSRGLPVNPIHANYRAAISLLLSWGSLSGKEATDSDSALLAEAYRVAPEPPRFLPPGFRPRWAAMRGAVCETWNREVMGGSRPPFPLESF